MSTIIETTHLVDLLRESLGLGDTEIMDLDILVAEAVRLSLDDEGSE